jgi:dTDP-4-dehydrorhamnose 3,5-epimerase
MTITEKRLKGLFEIELSPFEDHRGFFMRTYDASILIKLGLNREWVQENHSSSAQKRNCSGTTLSIIAPYRCETYSLYQRRNI